MRVEVTTFRDSYEEAIPLIEKHWDEVPFGTWKDIGINVNCDAYFLYEDQGYLRVIVARDDEKADQIVGYIVITPTEMNHHKGVWHAMTDVVYVDPTYRGHGIAKKMFALCMEECKRSGVTFFSVGVNTNYDFSELLKKEGAIETSRFYSWRI